MSWQDAKGEAEALAEKLPLNMKGKFLQVPDFVTDEDCRAFYPYGLAFHKMILSAMRKIAWKRGTHLIVPMILYATPTFLRWDQDERFAFADRLFAALDVTGTKEAEIVPDAPTGAKKA